MAGITNTPPAALPAAAAAAGVAPPGGSPALSSPSTVSPTSLLGSGGFGCVLSPPLSNIDESGANKAYPGNVMKVFFKKEAAEKAVTNANALKAINNPNSPLFSYPITKYRKSYKKKNIPPQFHTKCRINSGELEENIFPVRMPDLGKSLWDILKSPELLAIIKAMPLKILLNGFLKLLKTIKQINDNNKIHRDVKPQNILINLTTGEFTLIDFDLLTSKKNAVINGFYQWNSPFETIFWQDFFFVEKLISEPDFKPFENVVDDDPRDEVNMALGLIQARVNIFENNKMSQDMTKIEYYLQLSWFENWVKNLYERTSSLQTLTSDLATEKILLFFRLKTIPTYDSYFVAMSFLTLLLELYFDKNKKPPECLPEAAGNCDTLNQVMTIIKEMILFDPFTRLTADAAIPRLETIIGSMAGGKRKHTRRVKRAKPSRKRRLNRFS